MGIKIPAIYFISRMSRIMLKLLQDGAALKPAASLEKGELFENCFTLLSKNKAGNGDEPEGRFHPVGRVHPVGGIEPGLRKSAIHSKAMQKLQHLPFFHYDPLKLTDTFSNLT